jgi:hypothetical protein
VCVLCAGTVPAAWQDRDLTGGKESSSHMVSALFVRSRIAVCVCVCVCVREREYVGHIVLETRSQYHIARRGEGQKNRHCLRTMTQLKLWQTKYLPWPGWKDILLVC